MTRQELFDSAMDQPLSMASTFYDQAVGGALESFGLGTAIRSVAIPEGAPSPEDQMRSNMRLFSPLAPTEIARRTAQAFVNEPSPTLDEKAYKASPHYRENIPWDAGMTEARAQALAEWDDAKSVRQFYADKRPFTAFFGNLAGQALDPINYIPVGGPLVKAAALAKFGRVGATVAAGAVDAAANTALFGAITRDARRSYGDDVSWQSTISEIATAALIGGAFGAVGGALEGRQIRRAVDSLSTLKTTQEARIALNEAIDAVVRGEDVKLTPNATEPMQRVARDVSFPDRQERMETIDRIAREEMPVGKAPRKQTTLTQFIASVGGIKDESGELAAMGLSRKFLPGQGALVRKSGKTLDYAREAAAEAGFFDHIYGDPDIATAKSTPDDLLNLLAKEQGGEPTFSSRLDGELGQQQADYDASVRAQEQYRRVIEEIDGALDELGIEHRIDDAILRRAAELSSREGEDAVSALERAIHEDYRAFADALDERGQGLSDEPDFDIPFFDDTGPGPQAGRDAGAPLTDLGQGGRRADAPDSGQSARAGFAEGTARQVNTANARPDPVPEGRPQAETAVGKPDDMRAIAEQHGVDMNTGDFAEMADIEQLRALGRLTAEDEAELAGASETVDTAEAYGNTLKAALHCLI